MKGSKLINLEVLGMFYKEKWLIVEKKDFLGIKPEENLKGRNERKIRIIQS